MAIAGRRARITFAAAIAGVLAGCGDIPGEPHAADPRTYLVTLDQLVTPDFITAEHAADQSAEALATQGVGGAASLASAGLRAAARVRFLRPVDLATANGPVDIIAVVERFGDAAGATTVFTADVARLDGSRGDEPVSTGPLGDAAHAVSVVATTPGGIAAVQLTLEWRVGNLVNIVIVRGRYGGTRVDDALIVAVRQTANETR